MVKVEHVRGVRREVVHMGWRGGYIYFLLLSFHWGLELGM